MAIALPASDDRPAASADGPINDAMKASHAAGTASARMPQQSAPRDPLAPIQAMSDEEKIALFS